MSDDPPLMAADAQRRTLPGLQASTARPFVKWVGGKRQVMGEILEHLLPMSGCYHEPFLGGGAVFFNVSQRSHGGPTGVRLSDGNARLVRTWRTVRDELEPLMALLAEHKANHCKKHYYETRALDVDNADDVVLAAWFIYMNKTGFNGLYRVNSKGIFNVPMGSYKKPRILDEPNLRAANALLQGVEIHHQDFEQALEAVVPGDTVYFDPPYVPLSRSSNFTSYTAKGFGPADQQRLATAAAALVQRGVRVVLSNHDSPELRELYPEPFEIRSISARRNVNRDVSKRSGVTEVLIWAG